METSEGTVIPGLYAAGANSAGIPRSAGTYCSGQSIGDATFFGRRAGRSAAAAPVAETFAREPARRVRDASSGLPPEAAS